MSASIRGISPSDRGGSIGVDGVREYRLQYKVTTTDSDDGPSTVRTAFGLPNIGDLYAPGNDFDAAAIVTNKEVISTESPWEWFVEITYSTKSEQPTIIDNPLNKSPEVSYGFQSRRVLVPGRYNNPDSVMDGQMVELGIYAPNGELFDPQPEIELNEPVLTVKRNVQTISGQALMTMANAVNQDSWQGAFPRQLRLMTPQANLVYHQQVGSYWEVTYQIAFRYETWDTVILNQGTYYFAGGAPTNVWGSTNFRTPFTDGHGGVILGNLTTAGDKNNTAVPTFSRFRVYREINFGSLGIL